MVFNAEDALGRIDTLVYLLIERYEVDAREAGRRMGADSEPNELRDLTISDLRTALTEPAVEGDYSKDESIRQYLTVFLEAYDQARGAQ